MITNKSQIETEVQGKKYLLLCDQDSPLIEVKESLFQLIKFIEQIEEKIVSQQLQALKEQEEDQKKEDAK